MTPRLAAGALLALLTVAKPATALADGEKKLDLGGRIATYFRAPLDGLVEKPIQQLSTSATLDANARITEGTFAKVQATGDLLTPSIARKVEARGRLREAYAGAHKEGFEVRIGQQMITWGNADAVTAVDLFTARDYTFFSATPDANRIGAPAVMATYAGDSSPLRIALVWQPVHPSSRLLLPKKELPPNIALLEEDRQSFRVVDSEVGVKLGWAPGGWDVSLIGFRGFNHVAEGYFKGASNGRLEIGRKHNPYLAAGVEASMATGEWVLRFEGAYVATENHDGRNPTIQPTHIDAIAGVERPLSERIRVSAQAVVRAHPLFLPPEKAATDIDRALAQANSVLLNYTHVVRPGATLRAGYVSEDESLEIELAGLAYFVGFDWVVQPQIGYRPIAPLKLQVGMQMFGGHKNSLGSLDAYSGAFAQSTYTF
jgi:hypothetical protein